MIIGAPQETEPIWKDLQGPFTIHESIHLDALFQDVEDQLLLLHPRDFRHVVFASFVDKLRHRHLLKFSNVGATLFDFWKGFRCLCCAMALDVLGDFFCQR